MSFTDTSGGNVTEWRWSFGDGATSDLRSPAHVWSTPGFYDVTLTVSDGSSADSATRTLLVEAAVPAGSCRVDEETTCLQNSRFEVKANWWKADGEAGAANVVGEGTDDSGLFRFFDPENWEILVKVLDGCGINGRTWVLGASTTDLGYRIVVTDTVTGESRSYENEPGQPRRSLIRRRSLSPAQAARGLSLFDQPAGAGAELPDGGGLNGARRRKLCQRSPEFAWVRLCVALPRPGAAASGARTRREFRLL